MLTFQSTMLWEESKEGRKKERKKVRERRREKG
jgi:hypothetical protein